MEYKEILDYISARMPYKQANEVVASVVVSCLKEISDAI